MNATTGHLNNLMAIIGSADHGIDNKRCDDAMNVLCEYEKQWIRTAQISGIGTKYHYLYHCIEYMRIWRIPIGYINEQSIENFHKTCSRVFRRYKNQRGLLKIKYSMHQLMLITSPLYTK